MADWSRLVPGALLCKRFCLRHGRAVVVILGVVGVIALGLGAFAGFAPGTETVTEAQAAQTITAETDVSAVVGPGSSLWEEGTRLENRPAYILTASPEATINATIGVSDGTFTDVDPTFRLEYRAVRNEETIWNESRPLETAVEHDDDAVAAGTTVNASAVAQRIRSREEDVGGAAEVQAAVVLEVPYETDRYDGTLRAEFPLTVDGPAYELDPDTVTEQRTTPVQVEQPADPNVPLVVALLLLGVLGLGGAVGAHRVAAGPSSAAELLELEREIEHARYAEWISGGEFPTDLDHEYVRLQCLDDLVNLAIDTNRRVIYDQEREAYAVVTPDVLYYVGDRSEIVPEWQFGAIPDLAEIEH